MKAKLTIVDRDARFREWMRHHLGVLCPEGAITAMNLTEFQRALDSTTREGCDVLVLAARFGASPDDPESEGLAWLRQVRERPAFPPVIAIAEDGNELTAVRAVQLGAIDYLPKRLLTPERLRTSVRLALRRVQLRAAEAASALASSAASLLREPIPGYNVRLVLGESDKAVVFLASSAALGSDVALKVVRDPEAPDPEDPEQRQLLAREHAAVTSIRHPSIVTIHDYGTHDGREYLAMEYFARGDLKARIQRGLSEADALRYLEQIARALQVVHEAGIFHRDLKPPNVMLREDDTVALIDFGLARDLHGALQSTRKGVLRGSPYYMSPEQALGEPLDARTDIYSLGVICYEMLTGRKPYAGTSAIDVLQQHVNAPLPRLPTELEHLQPLLDGMLAKSPGDRMASAAQVAEAVAGLRALRDGGASVAVA